MKRSTFAVMIAAFAVIGGSALFWGLERHGVGAQPTTLSAADAKEQAQDAPLPVGPSVEVAALMQQVMELRGELAALKRAPAAAMAPNDGVSENPGERKAPLDPAEMERQKQQWHAHMADVEAAFHVEAHDPKWATEVSSTVRQAFSSDESVGAQLRGVECRSRTCRLEFADDGPEPLSDMLVPILAKLADTLPKAKSELIEEPNGKKTTVLFMSRRPEG